MDYEKRGESRERCASQITRQRKDYEISRYTPAIIKVLLLSLLYIPQLNTFVVPIHYQIRKKKENIMVRPHIDSNYLPRSLYNAKVRRNLQRRRSRLCLGAGQIESRRCSDCMLIAGNHCIAQRAGRPHSG